MKSFLAAVLAFGVAVGLVAMTSARAAAVEEPYGPDLDTATYPDDYERIFDIGNGVFDSPGGPASVSHRVEVTPDDRYVVVPVSAPSGTPNLPTDMNCNLGYCEDLAVWDRVTDQVDVLTHEFNGDLGPASSVFYWADAWDITPDLRYLLATVHCAPGSSMGGYVCGPDGDQLILRHDRVMDRTDVLVAAITNGPFSLMSWQISDDGKTVLLTANGDMPGVSGGQPHCPVPTDVDCEFLQQATYLWREGQGWEELFRTEDYQPTMDGSGSVASFVYEYTICDPSCEGFFGLAWLQLASGSIRTWEFSAAEHSLDSQTIPFENDIYYQSWVNMKSGVYRLNTDTGQSALLKDECLIWFGLTGISDDGRYLLCEQGPHDNRIWMIDTATGETMDIFTPGEGFHGINDGYGIGNRKVVTRAPHQLNAPPDAWLTDQYNYWVWIGEFNPKGPPSEGGTGTFDDDDGSTFEADIEWLAAEGITRGCNPPINNLFCPEDFVTRGQMAAFLHRALDNVLTPTQSVEFIDDNGNTFENDIEWLGGTGVTKGCNPPTNNRYCPSNFVTRGQMAAFLVRALGYTDNGGGDLFIDDDGNTFEADIDRLGTAGVTRGCNPPTNDRFCPNDFVTRGQMAAFLHRALGD